MKIIASTNLAPGFSEDALFPGSLRRPRPVPDFLYLCAGTSGSVPYRTKYIVSSVFRAHSKITVFEYLYLTTYLIARPNSVIFIRFTCVQCRNYTHTNEDVN